MIQVGRIGAAAPCAARQYVHIEDLVIDTLERRTGGALKHPFRACGVAVLEFNAHLDVVEHLHGARDGVIADGLHDEPTERDATHGAQHLDHGNRIVVVAVAGIGYLIEGIFHRTRINVLADRRLHGRDRVNAIVAQGEVRFGMGTHRNNGRSSRGNSDESCKHRQLRLANVAVGIGAFDV